MKPLKHSTADWDFDSANWYLDPEFWHSSPTSLLATVPTIPLRVLIKTSVVPIANEKEGCLATWLRMATFGNDGLGPMYRVDYIFRYQDDNNFYYVRISQNSATAVLVSVIRRYGGAETTLRSAVSENMPRLTWNKARVIFWNDYVGLVVRCQRWDGSAYTNLILDTYDTLNYWKDVGGRVGFRIRGNPPSYKTNIDDSEIYGIPP